MYMYLPVLKQTNQSARSGEEFEDTCIFTMPLRSLVPIFLDERDIADWNCCADCITILF